MRRLPAPAGFDAMTRAPCEPVAAGTGPVAERVRRA